MSKKLLLADDSITIQKVIGITFANEEYDLTIVGNGEVALEKARANRPDLILADVFMPGKNGYELTAAVKRDPALQGVPVLLLAGTFEPFDEDKARGCGADGWISKPFESQTLIDEVEALLARGAATAAPAPMPEAAAQAPTAAPEEEQAIEWGETIELDQAPEAGDEDLWGAVSFAEEDLGGEAEDFGEDSFVFEEDLEAAAPVPELSAGDEEEDFLFEEPLELAGRKAGEVVLPTAEEEPIVFEEEPLDLAEETPAQGWETAETEEEDFVFEEEPLELMAEPPAGEQVPEAAAPPAGEAFEWDVEPAAPAAAEGWEEPEEDIFVLEEADILEEEELETESLAAAEIAPGVEEPDWEEAGVEDIFAAPEEELSLGGEEDEWEIAEPESEVEETFVIEEEPAPVAPAVPPAPAPAPLETAEAQVRGLSEEDLARVVEKVAGSVVEKLAATVLEKIAWEVVPDLAESMIRDELRRLKGETQG